MPGLTDAVRLVQGFQSRTARTASTQRQHSVSTESVRVNIAQNREHREGFRQLSKMLEIPRKLLPCDSRKEVGHAPRVHRRHRACVHCTTFRVHRLRDSRISGNHTKIRHGIIFH